MKKWLLVLLTLALSLTLALGISACNKEEEHTHDWSTDWSSDETNHWHNCNGCDQHTGTAPHEYDDDSDETCNVCGKTRHVHTYAWDHDSEYHWQKKTCHPDDEQKDKAEHDFSNGPVCPVCGYDSTGQHVHTYAWQFDNEKHWEQSTCTDHDPVTRNEAPHSFDPETHLCECGISEVETQVYDLYKSNAELKGETQKGFAEWRKEWKDMGVDHVGFNSLGDGVFYTATATAGEFTEQVAYFAERTLTVTAQYHNGSRTDNIANVCFVVKCKVDGEFATLGTSAVLAVGKTDGDGTLSLAFTPIFGYTAANVEYVVALAADSEKPQGTLTPLPTGVMILDSDKTQTLTVNSTSATLTADFTVYRTLGTGDRGKLDNVWAESYNVNGATEFYLDDSVTAGVYKVILKGTEEGLMTDGSTFVFVDGGGSQGIGVTVISRGVVDVEGGEGWFYVTITDDSQLLSIRRTIGAFIGDIELIKFTAPEITSADVDYDLAANVLSVNQADANLTGITYDISKLPNGFYIFNYASTNSTFSTKLGTKSIYRNSVFEKTSEDTTLSFDADADDGVAVHNFRLTNIEVIENDNEITVPFTATAKSFIYSFTPDQKGMYSITIAADGDGAEYKDFSLSYLMPDGRGFGLMSRETGSSTKVYFDVNEFNLNKTFIFTASTTNDDCAKVNMTFHFEKAQEISLDTPFDITFSAEDTHKDYTITIPHDLYLVKITGDNLENVSVSKGSSSFISSGKAGDTILTGIFFVQLETQEVTLKFEYSGSGNYPTIHAEVERVSIETANSATANTPFEVTFADTQLVVYKVAIDENGYFRLLINSEQDFKDMAVYYYRDGDSNVSSFTTKSTSERKEFSKDYGSGNQQLFTSDEFYLMFTVDKTSDYPTVTADLHHRFNLSNSTVSKSGDTGVQIPVIAGATDYDLYMASNKYGPFEVVKSFTSEDTLIWYYDQQNGGYRHFYFVAKDSTGKYLDTQSQQSGEYAFYFESQKQYTINLTVPEGFNASLKIELMENSSAKMSVTKQITASDANTPLTFMAPESVNKAKITLNDEKYAFKGETGTSKTTSFSNESVTFEFVNRPAITVSVTIPEGFTGNISVAVKAMTGGATYSLKSKTITVEAFEGESKTEQVIVYANISTTNEYKVYISNTLPEGFNKGETGEIEVDFDEATNSGTAALTIVALPVVTVNMTFPAKASGSFVVKFYNVESSSVEAGKVTIAGTNSEEATSTASGTIRLPEGEYNVTIIVPGGSGYSFVENVTTLTVSGKTATIDLTVVNPIVVTVTIEAETEVDMQEAFLEIKVYEQGQESGNAVASIWASNFENSDGKWTCTTTVKLPVGKQYVVKDASDYSGGVTVSINGEPIDITIDGNTGSVNITLTITAAA